MFLTGLASLHRLDADTSLLVNALSGAVDLVDNELRAQLLDIALGGRPNLRERYRRLLKQRGYLFAGEGGERAALQSMYEAYERITASRPIEFVVCPTYTCNLACTYCYQSDEVHAMPEVMTDSQVTDFYAALEAISSEHPDKSRQIILFGGEPLLPATETVVVGILDRAERAQLGVSIVTNGTHMERFASLLTSHRSILKSIQITLDGPEPIHDARRKGPDGRGSFAEVVRAIELCLDAGIPVNVRVNLDAHNLGSLEDLVGLLQQRGWTGRDGFRCLLAPVTDHVGTSTYAPMLREDQLVEPVLGLLRRRPELQDVLELHLFRVLHHLISVLQPHGQARSLPRFHYCEADRGDVYTFGPDGLIYICTESAGISEYAVGTYSPRYRLWPRRLRRWQNRSILTLPECQECNIATFCGGGCAYAALRQSGGLMHGACGDAPEVLRAYVAMLRRRFQQGELTLSAADAAN